MNESHLQMFREEQEKEIKTDKYHERLIFNTLIWWIFQIKLHSLLRKKKEKEVSLSLSDD